MDTDTIRVLLIEDDLDDVLLLKEALAQAGTVKIKITHADCLSKGLKRVAEQEFDVILLDLNLPDSRGLDTLSRLLRRASPIPIVVIGGLADDPTTFEAVRQGAQDYLVKGEISGPMLGRVLRYAIERKQAEQVLRESERSLKLIAENTRDTILAYDMQQRLIYVNPAVKELTGYGADELMERNFINWLHPDDEARMMQLWDGLYKGQGYVNQEFRIVTKSGQVKWCLGLWGALYDENGQQIGVQGSERDITNRKLAEEALQKSESSLQAVLQSTADGILAIGSGSEVLYANEQFAEMWRIPQEVMASKDDSILLQHVLDQLIDPQNFLQKVQELYKSDEESFDMLDFKDGRVFERLSRPLMQEAELLGRVWSFRDVTERKRTEAALLEERYLLNALLNNVPDYIYFKDLDSRFIRTSKAHARAFGLSSPAQAVGKSDFDFFTEEHARAAYEDEQQIIHTGQPFSKVERETWADRPDTWVMTTKMPLRDQNGKIIGTIGISKDITERKLAEDALRKSERELKEAQLLGRVGNWEYDIESQKITWSDETYRLYERDPVLGPPTVDEEAAYYSPEQAQMLHEYARRAIEEGQHFEYDLQAILPSGKHVYFSAKMQRVKDASDRIVKLFGTVQDITERKRTEETLRESENRFRTLFEQAAVGVALLETKTGRYVRINQKYCDFLGYTIEEMLNKTFQDVTHPDDTQTNMDNNALLIAGTIREFTIEKRYICKDGRVVWGNLTASPLWKPGTEPDTYLHIAVVEDITERKRAEEALVASEAELRTLFAAMTDVVIIYDANGQYLKIAPTKPNNFAHSPVEMLGKNVYDILPKEKADYIVARIGEAIHTGQVVAGEYMLKVGGEDRWYASSASRLSENTAVWVAHDITNRKLAEENLARLHQQTELILSSAAEGILGLNLQGNHTFVNPAAASMLGYEVEELLDGPSHGTWHHTKPDGSPFPIEECGISITYLDEMVHRQSGEVFWRKDGTSFPVEYASTPIFEQGRLVGVEVTFTDITERKQAEQQIQIQMERLKTLWEIDRAITSSFDLSVTLNLLVSEVNTSLQVDAAAISLLNPNMNTLEFAAGQGFHGRAPAHSHAWLSEDYAGEAVMQRRTIAISDLTQAARPFPRRELSGGEDFAAFFVVPLIARGEVKGVLEVFQRTALTPDEEWLNFLNMLADQAAIAIDNAQLIERMQNSNLELVLAYNATIEGWSHAMDLRDKETEGHTQRVTEMAVQLARGMGLSEAEIGHLRRGALLHDIGKMGVPDTVLLKPDKLTDDEWVLIYKHPQLAFDMLAPITYLKPALDIPFCHHEKWDGTGYPRGIKGEQIPLAARLFAIVDVYDALRSDRPYRKMWSHEKVIKYIRSQSGIHFDPKVVEVFLKEFGYKKNPGQNPLAARIRPEEGSEDNKKDRQCH
jgi:PAS domain S-box-containing protein